MENIFPFKVLYLAKLTNKSNILYEISKKKIFKLPIIIGSNFLDKQIGTWDILLIVYCLEYNSRLFPIA